MRQIINISLPPETAKQIKLEVKRGNYISTSEFFRTLIRDWQEKKLLNELRQSQQEIKSRKGKKLNSLKDLR